MFAINGSAPRTELPKRHVHAGEVWTHLHSLSEPELAAIGVVTWPDPPPFDPATEVLEHDDQAVQWIVRAKTQAELDADAAAERAARLSAPMSYADFFDLFTQSEAEAIYTAAKSSIEVEIFVDRSRSSNAISLLDQRVIDGINAIEAAGLLAPGRGAQILNGDAPPAS